MNFRKFIKIIEGQGFALTAPPNGTSHRKYTARIGGKLRVVTVAYHRAKDDITPKTLASMIRQSGLSKKLFRQ